MSAYHQLEHRSRECALIGSACAALHWDHQTCLPAKAAAYRGEQTAYLSALAHQRFTVSEVGRWLADSEARIDTLTLTQQANLREWRRRHDRAVKIPPPLVAEFERATTAAYESWSAARRDSDFAVFRPHLEKVIGLRLQMADLWGWEKTPYNALLNEFEPDADSDELGALFTTLTPRLTELLARGAAVYETLPDDFPAGPYPLEQQRIFNQTVAAKFGFDFAAGRIDATAHPFCIGLGPDDCRLTTRYTEDDFTHSLYSVLHETGHGLYDQGTPKEHHGTPAGEAVSLGIHESQSRFWENHVARHESFWEHWLPAAAGLFPQLRKITPLTMTRHVNRIRRGFIRVDADEVSYDLHIILRFNAETRLLNRTLTVRELPEFWNAEFKRLFTVSVPDDAHGCLQDVHWSGGMLGYFPTYTLGNLNAAQLAHTMRRAIPGMPAQLAAGEYGAILSWLRANLHRHGSLHRPATLMMNATGERTNPAYHLAHLENKIK
ncbi:MAG: carboxypeptidase M32 [Verrucomicrobiales bacterium]|jgi:carboxypeptidase Taq|nr:carboxypeptidase M32 [Verrucomicrobiales bacterium]